MNELKENVVGTRAADAGVIGFSVDDLLNAILTPPPPPPENNSYPATVRYPVEAAEAYTDIPD
jgi:hypothetical protein